MSDAPDKRIAVHHNEKVILVKLGDIVYIEGADRYSYIHTADEQRYLLTKTIKEFEDFLKGNPNFLRISKSKIINVSFIKEYTKGESSWVVLTNGEQFEISRRKKAEINAILKR